MELIQKTCKNKSAFTLAEVLITLAIIGVVAALTIPNLIVNYQKQQTVEKLKKVYASLSQAVRQSEIENGPSKDWDWGIWADEPSVKKSFDTYWAPYLKILKFCTKSTPTECGYTDNVFYHLDKTVHISITGPSTRTAFLVPDGVMIMIRVPSNSGDHKGVYVDLNAGKGPNIEGKDVFIFTLSTNKGLVPNGFDVQDATINANCSPGGNGLYCTAKIIKDGWQIKDDYPWE